MNRLIWLAPVISLLLVSGCSSRYPASGLSSQASPETARGIEGVFVEGQEGDKGCPYPVEGFDEEMLVGTWRAGFGDEIDVLIFREDGFYRQVTTVEALGFHMESDWQPWRVSYGPSGIPQVHLEGMRLCVPYHLPECGSRGGGEASWWDFCENRMVRMPDEGILLAMGAPSGFQAPSRGFSLVPLTRDPDSGGFSYQFEN